MRLAGVLLRRTLLALMLAAAGLGAYLWTGSDHSLGATLDLASRFLPEGQSLETREVTGSLRAGKRAAAIMSLIQSAKLNGHDPFLYLKDVLSRLPTQPNSRIGELLPHRWQPPQSTA